MLPLPYFRLKIQLVRDSPDFWGPLFVVLLYAVLSLYGQIHVKKFFQTFLLTILQKILFNICCIGCLLDFNHLVFWFIYYFLFGTRLGWRSKFSLLLQYKFSGNHHYYSTIDHVSLKSRPVHTSYLHVVLFMLISSTF